MAIALWATVLELGVVLAAPSGVLPTAWNKAIPAFCALICVACWAFAWAARTLAYIEAFGRWPSEIHSKNLVGQDLHAALAATAAFEEGRFEEASAFLRRIEGAAQTPGLRLALGRSLALGGDAGQAVEHLEAGGERAWVLEGLRRHKTWWGVRAPTFVSDFPDRRRRTSEMAALGLAVAAGTGALGWALEHRPLRGGAAEFQTGAFMEADSGRFRVFYHDAAFRDQATAAAETALDADCDFLGLARDSFGPGAVRLYLCDSEEEYRNRAPGHPSWEAACALPDQDIIYIHSFGTGRTPDFEVALAHELGHLCYYRLVGSSPDDWLNEGLADYLGFRFGLGRAGIPREAWLQERYFSDLKRRYLPFDAFFTLDPRRLSPSDVEVFYPQGFSIVYVLIEDYGRESFMKFVRAYNSGVGVDRALSAAFPTIRDRKALAAVWELFYLRPGAQD
jgi:hypothetical protein